MNTHQQRKFRTIALLTSMVAVFFILLIVVFQQEEKKRIALRSSDLLTVVATSEQEQISTWLLDEIQDANLISKNNDLVELITKFVKDKGNESALLAAFNQIKEEHNCSEVVLLSETGDYLTSTNQALTFNDSIDKRLMARALKTDSSYVSDIYRSSVDHAIYVDLVSIIRNQFGKPIGGLILKYASENTIDAILNDWEVAGYRCFLSLIQRQANSTWIIYKPDTTNVSNPSAWKPLSTRFKQDPFGKQLKWVKVLGLPNTSWYLMAEMDNSQRKAETGDSITLLSLVSLVSVLIFFMGLMFIARYQERNSTQKIRDKELECERINNQFGFTMDLLREAVLITDSRGLIQYMNMAAELVSGWSLKDSEGKPLDKVIPLLQEESGMPLLNVKNWFSGERSYNQHIPAYLVNKDGSHIRVICSIAQLNQETSENYGLVVVLVKDNRKHPITPDASEDMENPFPQKDA